MIIREFKNKDAEELSHLIIQNLETVNIKDYPREAIDALIPKNKPERLIEKSKNRILLVAEENNHVIGTASLVDNEVKSVFVDTKLHKQGIGKKLMQSIEDIAKKKGIKHLFLFASLTAVEFYKKLDYKVAKKVTEQIDNVSVSGYRMEKTLL
jgi:N-acetylglutamate synthase-like GNAT family acetyltransferase